MPSEKLTRLLLAGGGDKLGSSHSPLSSQSDWSSPLFRPSLSLSSSSKSFIKILRAANLMAMLSTLTFDPLLVDRHTWLLPPILTPLHIGRASLMVSVENPWNGCSSINWCRSPAVAGVRLDDLNPIIHNIGDSRSENRLLRFLSVLGSPWNSISGVTDSSSLSRLVVLTVFGVWIA